MALTISPWLYIGQIFLPTALNNLPCQSVNQPTLQIINKEHQI